MESKDPDKENRIIAGAIEAFAEKGRDVNLSVIGEYAGLSKSTIYRHFTDREEIIIKIHFYFWSKLVDELEIALKGVWSENALEKIKNFTIHLHRFVVQEKSLIKAVSNVRPLSAELLADERIRGERIKSSTRHETFLRKLDEIIKEGQDGGFITKEIPAKLVRQILMGGFEKLISDLYSGGRKEETEDLGYGPVELQQAIRYLLKSVCIAGK